MFVVTFTLGLSRSISPVSRPISLRTSTSRPLRVASVKADCSLRARRDGAHEDRAEDAEVIEDRSAFLDGALLQLGDRRRTGEIVRLEFGADVVFPMPPNAVSMDLELPRQAIERRARRAQSLDPLALDVIADGACRRLQLARRRHVAKQSPNSTRKCVAARLCLWPSAQASCFVRSGVRSRTLPD